MKRRINQRHHKTPEVRSSHENQKVGFMPIHLYTTKTNPDRQYTLLDRNNIIKQLNYFIYGYKNQYLSGDRTELHESFLQIIRKLPNLRPRINPADLTYKAVPNGVVYEDFVSLVAKLCVEYNKDEEDPASIDLEGTTTTKEMRQQIYEEVKRFIEEDIELRQVVQNRYPTLLDELIQPQLSSTESIKI